MSDKERKWKGIQVNMCILQGEVVEDPKENGGYYFLRLESKNKVRGANGQITEVPQIIPLMVEPGGPVSTMSHIKKGRKLLAWCNYKSWGTNNEHHAFVVKTFDLGDKPWDGDKQDKGNTPPLPA